ncbi:MAG: hypothetical protein ACRCZT_07990 [Plesiomonas sp.]
MILSMTHEQRLAALALGRAARKAKTEQWKANAHLLQKNFSDSAHWHKLASQFGVRMPGSHVPSSELKPIRKAMRTLNISPAVVVATFGGSIASLQAKNPRWPAFAIIGLLLEIAEQRELSA